MNRSVCGYSHPTQQNPLSRRPYDAKQRVKSATLLLVCRTTWEHQNPQGSSPFVVPENSSERVGCCQKPAPDLSRYSQEFYSQSQPLRHRRFSERAQRSYPCQRRLRSPCHARYPCPDRLYSLRCNASSWSNRFPWSADRRYAPTTGVGSGQPGQQSACIRNLGLLIKPVRLRQV